MATRKVKVTGSEGILSELQSWTIGPALLVAMGFGLFAYGVYRALGAFADIESEGNRGAGLGKRLGYFGSAIAYIALSATAFNLLGGDAGGDDGSSGSKGATAMAMTLPLGRWLVGGGWSWNHHRRTLPMVSGDSEKVSREV